MTATGFSGRLFRRDGLRDLPGNRGGPGRAGVTP
jgi:hypothetical protein